MTWQGFFWIFPYILSAILSAAIGLYAFRQRSLPGALAFAVLALAEAEWTAAYIFQSLTPALTGKLFWNNAQFLGAVIAPLAFCAFGFVYSGLSFPRKRLIWRVVKGAAALLLLLIWTNGLHGLFRVNPHLAPGQPFNRLVFTNGPAFDLYTIFGYSLLVAGTAALAVKYRSAPPIYRYQIGWLMAGMLIPWITTIVTWLEFVPALLHDATPLSFAVSNLVVFWTLFRYRLFDLVPIARSILVESMEDGVIVVDGELRLVDINPAGLRIFNLPQRQVIGRPVLKALPALAPAIPEPGIEKTLNREMKISLDGEPRTYEIRITPLAARLHELSGQLIFLRDITARKRMDEQLQRLAITDPLTNLFNRRHFFTLAEREYERALRTGSPLTAVLFDIDHFKTVNDRHGHLVGDQVLEQLADLCQGMLRTYDVLARYGGEEFVILLPDTTIPQALQTSERLRQKIEQTALDTKAGPVHITISLGIASMRAQPDRALDWLIDRADQALYEAKQKNRNCISVWRE